MAPAAQAMQEMMKSHKETLLLAIKAGMDEKRRVYLPGAKACSQFYLGEYKHLFKEQTGTAAVDNAFLTVNQEVASTPMRMPMFLMADNVVATYVQIFAPYLTQGEMTRTVSPTQPYAPPPAAYNIDPQPLQMLQMQNPQYVMQQQQAMFQMQLDQMLMEKDAQLRECRAGMLEILLQYFAKELNLRQERKLVVDESLVLGGGAYMTELVVLPESMQKMIGSNWLSINDIVWDPDCVRAKDAKWLAIRYRGPAWKVAEIFQVPEKDIRPNVTSTVGRSIVDNINIAPHLKHNMANDEVDYWKFYSRMGSGVKLRNVKNRNPMLEKMDAMLGDYCYFVVSDGCDYLLNFGPSVFDAALQAEDYASQIAKMPPYMTAGMPPPEDSVQIMKAACAWPFSFYMDVDDPWPITMLQYFTRPGSPYPVPPLEFCLSYLNFMAWVICFIADKCYRSMRTIWVLDESISEQLKKAILSGEDEAVVNMKEMNKETIKELVDFIDAPEIKKSIFEVYEFFTQKFERASGLTDLMQAKMARTRSATESKIIADASTLRPQAMADQVYHVDTRVARKEAIAAMSMLSGQDIAPIMGVPAGMAWQNLIVTKDIVSLMRETSYDVVASPGRVLDLNTRQEQANAMAQMVLPLLVNIGNATGLFGPANAILHEWAKANQIDPQLVAIPNMPPPQAEAKGVASPAKPEAKQAA